MSLWLSVRIPGLLVGLASGALMFDAFPRAAAQSPAPGGYTAAQADRGKALYAEHCSSCHGASLRGGANDFSAPALAGPFFFEKWAGKPVGELFRYSVENMPPGDARLPDAAYLDITAYILQVLKYGPGTVELQADSPIMKQPMSPNP